MKLNIIFRRTIILSILAITGCATTISQAALRVQVADEKAVANCTFLGEVHGTSGWGGLAASQGMENSMNEAREHAAGLGATNVVWDNLSGGFVPFAVGKAYRCDSNKNK